MIMILKRFLNRMRIGIVLYGIILGICFIRPSDAVAAVMEDTPDAVAAAVEDMPDARTERDKTIHLYPLWNEYPCIEAQDRYISMEEITSGKITEEEILSKIRVTDKEDGTGSEHLLTNTDTEKYVTVLDFSEEELASFSHDGAVSVTIQAVDSCGCITQKRIRINIVDTKVTEVPQMQVRFVSEKYLDTVASDSVWKQRTEYEELLKETVSENKEAGQKLVFSEEEVTAVKQYVEENGYADGKEKDRLRSFYEKFCRS